MKVYICLDLLKLIFQILKTDDIDAEHSLLIKELINFDFVMKGESKTALIYNVFEVKIQHLLHVSDHLIGYIKEKVKHTFIEADKRSNYLFYKLKAYKADPNLCLLEYKKSCSQFLIEAFNNAIKTIKFTLGTNYLNWK